MHNLTIQILPLATLRTYTGLKRVQKKNPQFPFIIILSSVKNLYALRFGDPILDLYEHNTPALLIS